MQCVSFVKKYTARGAGNGNFLARERTNGLGAGHEWCISDALGRHYIGRRIGFAYVGKQYERCELNMRTCPLRHYERVITIVEMV